MEKHTTSSHPAFENVVRDAILAQLTHCSVVDAITSAVMQRLDAAEDESLLGILKSEPDEGSVDVGEFLRALKS